MNTRFLAFLLLPFGLFAQSEYTNKVKEALAQTQTNRLQLQKALDYFYATGDSLKIKSINFLVANMPIHISNNYFWADSLGRHVAYNELAYGNFDSAVLAFEQLKASHGTLHPVPYMYRDLDSAKAGMLIENVELAVGKYRARGNVINEDDFLEYVLPYRVSVEPLQDWRKLYSEKFSDVLDPGKQETAQLSGLRKTENALFSNKWSVERKTEPLPRLSALQILLRQKGYCEDMAAMATFISRSRGVAASVDNIPAWATASGNHFLDFIRLSDTSQTTHFDAVLDSLGREPAKVLRTTFSPQKDAIATWLDTTYIPQGFLRIQNYRDVTNEYWPVDSISFHVFPLATGPNGPANPKVIYMAVLNTGSWKPIWYGRLDGNTATCQKMTKGVVYLPMYYINHQMVPAGWPYALGYHNKQVLKPDLAQTQTITMSEQEKYLKYRSGKQYRLFFWNNKWQSIANKTAPEGCTQLTFENVPKNALLMMIPEYSQRKERPFMITETGERVWW